MKRTLQIAASLLLAAVILYFVYRDFPFSQVSGILANDMQWHWIVIAIVMEVAAQTTRAIRWHLMLGSIGEQCRRRNAIGSVYISFAANLVVPRIGEMSRCALLNKTDGISFTKSLGTVIAERFVDAVILFSLVGIVILCQWDSVCAFFGITGTNFAPSTPTAPTASQGDSPLLPLLVAIAAVVIFTLVTRRIKRSENFKKHWLKFKEGILSVKHIEHRGQFAFLSLLIIVFNFLNLWCMFYAFTFTSHLHADAALLAFSSITFAMIVPTPNGAGPWHYVVKTCLVVYGIGAVQAGAFALIVHAIHMLCIIMLALVGLLLVKHRTA